MENDNFITSLDELMKELDGVKSARKQVEKTTEASTTLIKKLGEVQESWVELKEKWNEDWEHKLTELTKSFQKSTNNLTSKQDELKNKISETMIRAKKISEKLENFSNTISTVDNQLRNTVSNYSKGLNDNIRAIKELLDQFEADNAARHEVLVSRLKHIDESLNSLERNIEGRFNELRSDIKDITTQMDTTIIEVGRIMQDIESSSLKRQKELMEAIRLHEKSSNKANVDLKRTVHEKVEELREHNNSLERSMLTLQVKSGRIHVIAIILLFVNLILMGAILYLGL